MVRTPRRARTYLPPRGHAAAATRAATGLLLREDFAAPSGWTAAGGRIAPSAADPLFVAFDPLPIPALLPGVGTADAGGVREHQLFIEPGQPWRAYAGAGDGTAGSGGPWRPQAYKSTNRGLTWTRQGATLAPGTYGGTAYPAFDHNFTTKFGATYYQWPLSTGSLIAGQSGNSVVCGQPYGTLLASSATPDTLPWAYLGIDLAPAAGTNYSTDNYTGCVVKTGGLYYHFAGWTSPGRTPSNTMGLWTAATLGGAKTLVSANPFALGGFAGLFENPKTWFSAALNRWVLLTNNINAALGWTDGNVLFVGSAADVTDWASPRGVFVQSSSPLDGGSVPGIVGILSPAYAPEGLPVEGANGEVLCTFDCEPTPDATPWHEGRKVKYAVLEPSPACLRVAGDFEDAFARADSATVGNGWTQVAVNGFPTISGNQLNLGNTVGASTAYQAGVSVADCTQYATLTLGANSGVGFVFRRIDANNFYHCNFAAGTGAFSATGGGAVSVFKVAGGTETLVGSQVDVPALPADVPLSCSVTVAGSPAGFTFRIAGRTVAAFAEATAGLAAAGAVGLRNGYGGTSARLVKNYGYAAVGGAVQTYSKAVAHGPLVAEFACELHAAASVSGSYVALRYRDDGAGNYYEARLNAFGQLSLYRGGTLAAAGAGSQTFDTARLHRVKVSASGSTHTLTLNGQVQVTTTDAALATGTQMGFAAQGLSATVRLLHARTGGAVTVTGLTAGQVVTLRSAGGAPAATATASGSSVTLAAPHYPLAAVDVDGVDYPPAGSTVWGGDSYTWG